MQCYAMLCYAVLCYAVRYPPVTDYLTDYPTT